MATAKTVTRAVAYVVGLGYYKLYVNGVKASTHELGAFTTFTKRVYYDTWDVTALMVGSKQAIGVVLGNGWYSQPTVNVGSPSLYCRVSITFSDGTTTDVVSSTKWQSAMGPVGANDIYGGEVYDAQREQPDWSLPAFDASKWTAAAASSAPSATVKISSHARLPPIRVGETYSPITMYESSPGVYVYDFGQNMAGFVTLRIPSGIATAAGTNISMLHAEAVHGPPPAKIFHHYGGANKEVNTYLTSGNGKAVSYTAQFVYAGFRYVQLTGYPGVPDFHTLSAHFVHTDYEMIGGISFSDPMLDAVQHITRTAAMSNFQSIPTDCPQRERRGWLGDAQLSAETNMHNFDMAAPYTAFVEQIDDSLNRTTGATQDCVPWYGHGREPADPAWGTAFTFIADWVGKYYHDNHIFELHYDGITKHMNSLIMAASENHLNGLLTYSGWSDWCPPSGCKACWNNGKEKTGPNSSENSALVSSFYYIMELRIVARYAGILGHAADQAKYSKLAASAAVTFQKTFYNAKAKTYDEPGRKCAEYLSPQTTISLADELGVIPAADKKAVINSLVADVESHGWHLNVGIVGIKYLLPTLSRNGRGDVALMIAQQRTPPSYIYMVEQGATTMWETWTGSTYAPVASWNHIMFGSNSDWYYKYLAGLRQTDESRGWQQLELVPQVYNVERGASICANLSSTSASINTPRGPLSAAWTCGKPDADTCGTASEQSTLTLKCKVGTIKSVIFASYGTPAGSCGNFQLGMCNSNKSMAVVSAACVGKTSCTLTATSAAFGGDPCFDTRKQLSAQIGGCTMTGGKEVFTYKVTIPVGSTSTVTLPKMGENSVTVTADGKAVWSGGKFSPMAGVTAATDGGSTIVVSIGSGSYDFRVTA